MRAWGLWSLPRRAIAYALTVEAVTVAVAVVVALHQHVGQADWLHFAIIVGCGLVQAELIRPTEAARQRRSEASPVQDTDVLSIAAVIALPHALADLVVVGTVSWRWLRGSEQRRRWPYRVMFSAAAMLLGTQAAALVLGLDPRVFPGPPVGVAALGLAVLAGGLRWLVNFVLVIGAILLATPDARLRDVLADIGERVMEIGSLGLGIVAAGLLTYNPLLITCVVVGVVTMNRGVLLAQFRRAARTDFKTELTNADWWRQVATDAVRRAVATGDDLGVLMLDLDHFKRVNDTYGHLAGDRVLQAVAAAIRDTIRSDDIAGRWGGEEFAVLVPRANADTLVAVAERIRRRVRTLVVPAEPGTVIRDLTISIGAARLPDPAITDLDDLVRAADTALYAAKGGGRDQVRLAALDR